jgi:DNA (cytosine-5)-methyltransferase 1
MSLRVYHLNMKFGSVCSGIEAASVAWHLLGWHASWFSEIEPFPSAVLAHHYPSVPNLGDMTTLPDRILSGEVEAPDLFCGGTPCQAFSVAGLRRSLDDARGNLSLIFCEIADAIDHVRLAGGEPASIVFWENVPGVLSTKDNAFGCLLARLCGGDEPLHAPDGWPDAGCVSGPTRTAAWRVLDAQYFGLAQRRRRVFVVASARDGFDPAQVLLEFEGVRRDSAPRREAGEGVARGAAPSFGIRSANTSSNGWGIQRELTHTLDTASPQIVAQAFGGGQNCAETDVSTALSAHPGGSRLDFQTETFVAHTLRGEGFDAGEDGTGRGTPLVPVAMRESGQGYWMQDEIAGTLRAEGEDRPSRPSHVIGVPVPMINMQGSKGNAVAQADGPSFTLNAMHGHDVHAVLAPTLRAMNHADSHANGGGQMAVAWSIMPQNSGRDYKARPVDVLQPLMAAGPQHGNQGGDIIQTAMQVRRLTPVECERLQGFPDGYTAIPWRGKPASECPDGPRYKALGNSWAVPVVRWIGRRIDDLLKQNLIARLSSS